METRSTTKSALRAAFPVTIPVLTGFTCLGLAYGDENNRQCGKSVEFLEAFRKEFGSLLCRELVQPEGQEKKALCPTYIKFAANYLEEDFK